MTTLALNRRSPTVGALDSPLPSPPVLKPINIQQNAGSLYHTCRFVLDRLAAVEGMTECIDSVMLEEKQLTDINSFDPLTKLTLICRRGFPLCKLFNALNPSQPLSEERVPKLTMTNSYKANVYHFIVACRAQLSFPEEDMFTITDLYQDDTNGFVKVVNTVNKLLQLLEDRGIIAVRSTNRNSDPNAPRNTRDKVVLELLETERRYVHDMEILQNYMRELQNQKIVSPDTIHYLFGNLNALVDFQRRFLIHLEEIAELPAQEQRIGHLFVQMEDFFSVYEPYCANYYSAQDLVVQETPKLLKLADVMNPVYQLQSLLIKPVQRICKYPLLLNELVKSTDPNWEFFQETQNGLNAIKRVAEKVNETQRQHENLQIVEDLKKRLDESNIAGDKIGLKNFGNLVIQDKLLVTTTMTEAEKDLNIFCFETMLLFCKESKGSNILPKSNTLSINRKKRRGSLIPKFSVPINNICDMSTYMTKDNTLWCLVLEVNHKDLNQVTLKFRNEEQLKLWHVNLAKLKKAAYDSSLRVSNTIAMSSNNSSQNSIANPLTPNEILNEFYHDDNDDDEESDEMDGEDDDDIFIISRSRSGSFASQKQYQANHIKLSPSKSTDSGWKISTGGRPYQNVPGMNLSPLPRSNSSLANNMTPIQYGYYPASPPPSYPSSPTTSSSRVSSTSSSTTWYHQRHDPNALADISGKFLNNSGSIRPDEYIPHPPPLVGRTQSHSDAMSVAKMGQSRPFVQTQQQQCRLRSQSSPNIMNANYKNDVNLPVDSSMPDMPPLITSRVQKLLPVDLSQELQSIPNQVATKKPLEGEDCSIKTKLNFNDCVYVIVVKQEISYFELMEKVEKKIKLVGNLKSNDILRLKYQDEDGDFITINSDDDVQMAFESRGVHNTVNLFVSI